MPVNLSIENAPDAIVDRLRERASRHRRTLQGEVLAKLEESLRSHERLGPDEVLAEVRRLGLHTPSSPPP